MPQPERAVFPNGGDTLLRKAKHFYEQTNMPAQEIANMLGEISTQKLYTIARKNKWEKRPKNNKIQRNQIKINKTIEKDKINDRKNLIRKLEKTVEREINAIDAKLRKYAAEESQTNSIDHEKHARALATLARTLRELAAIDRAQTPIVEAQSAEGEDEEFPRDAEALRDALAKRLQQLSGQRTTEPIPCDV